MKLNDEQVVALVVAVLATYSYPLEKAWELRDRLRTARLSDPTFVSTRSVEEIGNLLKSAGYDRGGITYIIAPRVIGLMEAVVAGRLDGLADFVASANEAGFTSALQAVKGFGPKSAGLAWELMRAA